MRIEEYGINVNVRFHDIRKQGYEVPVEMQCMLKSFVEKIPQLPLVRGEIKIFRNDHFSISVTLGFKNGIFITAIPKVEYLKWNANNKIPTFGSIKNTRQPPVYGAVVLANKGEYTNFLNRLVEFAMIASAN